MGIVNVVLFPSFPLLEFAAQDFTGWYLSTIGDSDLKWDPTPLKKPGRVERRALFGSHHGT